MSTPTPHTPHIWTVSDTTGAKYIGTLELSNGEAFEILHTRRDSQTPHRLVFGGACNAGFLESGYLDIDTDGGESIDDALQELLEDLETYYTDGPRYTTRIIHNEKI